jgi:hypothetical protein
MLSWIRNLALRAALNFEKSRGIISDKTEQIILEYVEDKQ